MIYYFFINNTNNKNNNNGSSSIFINKLYLKYIKNELNRTEVKI